MSEQRIDDAGVAGSLHDDGAACGVEHPNGAVHGRTAPSSIGLPTPDTAWFPSCGDCSPIR